ncbi:hypothetical protein PN462_08515 [Spirulina sp. CS-785/01]|uniref:hypothetical protein n=1 Tax=Spirulina sp. CS-785/01 TaxID=3021716 RepID=UPI00232FE006|nr:hypothetical protein [Spirulina sp. CS-785/01]MDB9313142.1 hypothetical protein [Spirulina sp. CS-785/01]
MKLVRSNFYKYTKELIPTLPFPINTIGVGIKTLIESDFFLKKTTRDVDIDRHRSEVSGFLNQYRWDNFIPNLSLLNSLCYVLSYSIEKDSHFLKTDDLILASMVLMELSVIYGDSYKKLAYKVFHTAKNEKNKTNGGIHPVIWHLYYHNISNISSGLRSKPLSKGDIRAKKMVYTADKSMSYLLSLKEEYRDWNEPLKLMIDYQLAEQVVGRIYNSEHGYDSQTQWLLSKLNERTKDDLDSIPYSLRVKLAISAISNNKEKRIKLIYDALNQLRQSKKLFHLELKYILRINLYAETLGTNDAIKDNKQVLEHFLKLAKTNSTKLNFLLRKQKSLILPSCRELMLRELYSSNLNDSIYLSLLQTLSVPGDIY